MLWWSRGVVAFPAYMTQGGGNRPTCTDNSDKTILVPLACGRGQVGGEGPWTPRNSMGLRTPAGPLQHWSVETSAAARDRNACVQPEAGAA